MKLFLSALTAAVLAMSAPAFADTATATPILELMNRPTVTQSTYVVEKNHALLEAGYNNTSFAGAGSATTLPRAQIRIGTNLKNLEVDVKAPSIVRVRAGGLATGSDDVQAGVKYLIRNAARYAVSAQFGVDIPTGTLGQTGTQTSFGLNGTYKISSMFSVKTTQSFTAQNVAGIRYGSYTPSFVVAAMLPRQTSVFGEYSLATKAYGPATPSRSTFLLGASHAISNRLAVDIEASRSPGSNNVPKSTGFGFGAAYGI